MKELVSILSRKKSLLNGGWIKRNNSYERELCSVLEFNCETKRYWDCEYNGRYIEIKKGRSIWLDEVRYCEIFLKTSKESSIETVTLFFVNDKQRENIDKIYIVETKKILDFLKINDEWARVVLARKNAIKRSLNCQQNMTLKDLREICDYEI